MQIKIKRLSCATIICIDAFRGVREGQLNYRVMDLSLVLFTNGEKEFKKTSKNCFCNMRLFPYQ